MRFSFPRSRILLLLTVILVGLLPACSSTAQAAAPRMLDMQQLPAQMRAAPATVRAAYQFAAANPELMKHVPCYCGCGSIGHTSNYDCYVSAVDTKGAISFDDHALGCSLCVDITQAAIRLSGQGKSAAEIRAYVDSTYSKYGTSNLP